MRQHKLHARVTLDPMGSSDRNICSLGREFEPKRKRHDKRDSRRHRACIERAVSTRIGEKIITFLVSVG